MSARCKQHCAGWVTIAGRSTVCARERCRVRWRVCRRIPRGTPPEICPSQCGAHCTCPEFVRMNSAPSQSLINLLLESGVPSNEEAVQLATNLNGASGGGQVLDSGKVDENRFLSAIGNFFRVPVVSLDAKKINRDTLSILPSRFVFQHQILPIEIKENSVVL